MATVGNTYLTYADLRKRKDPNDQIARIIEMGAQINPFMGDAPVMECNDGSKHLTTVRSGYPSGTWRMLYQGVQPSKSTTKQVTDATGFLEAWSEIDAKLVEISNDPAGTRLSEATAFIEGMNQDMATAVIYADTATSPQKFMGLAPRFSSLSAENGGQIVDGGGTGSDNTSIWFMVWGERTCHLLYPKGSQGGLQREDKGKQTKTLSDNSIYDVYREKFSWDVGVSVRDWRYIARVANIDVTLLTADGSSGAKLLELMISAYYKLRQRRIVGGTAAIYCNTKVKEFLHKQALSKTNNALRIVDQDGEEIVMFLGMPVRECDAILNTEGRVT